MEVVKEKGKKTGFTLIELIIIIAILAILAIIIFISSGKKIEAARDAERDAEVKQIELGLEIQNVNNNKYPEVNDWTKIEEDDDGNGFLSLEIKKELKTIPRDPLYPKTTTNKTFSYMYKSGPNGTCYKIHADKEVDVPIERSSPGCESLAYTGSGGEESSPSPSGSGEDQNLQNCINQSNFTIRFYPNLNDITLADRAKVPDTRSFNQGWLSNYCSGRNSRVSLYECLDDDPNCQNRQLLGTADNTISSNNDNVNETFYDFNPDIPFAPIEWWDYQIF